MCREKCGSPVQIILEIKEPVRQWQNQRAGFMRALGHNKPNTLLIHYYFHKLALIRPVHYIMCNIS